MKALRLEEWRAMALLQCSEKREKQQVRKTEPKENKLLTLHGATSQLLSAPKAWDALLLHSCKRSLGETNTCTAQSVHQQQHQHRCLCNPVGTWCNLKEELYNKRAETATALPGFRVGLSSWLFVAAEVQSA